MYIDVDILEVMDEVDCIYIVVCGISYYVGLVGK